MIGPVKDVYRKIPLQETQYHNHDIEISLYYHTIEIRLKGLPLIESPNILHTPDKRDRNNKLY